MAGASAPAVSLTTRISPEETCENVKSALSRDLPLVALCKPHATTLSVAAGGPSLADTYQELTGYIGAVNGSLAFLMDKGVLPDACAVLDPGAQMADIVPADRRVRYFIASTCHPTLFDKLKNCSVHLWHPSGQPGLAELLPEDAIQIGGGSTMGLRWINLGYACGFRYFDLHGLDSSFRGSATHAYADWVHDHDTVIACGRLTKPAFVKQALDFFGVMERMTQADIDPIKLKVFGDGLLQDKWADKQRGLSARIEPSDKPLRVCCIKVGDKYGPEYVTRLRDGVTRYLDRPHEFVCYTDKPVPGVKCEPPLCDLPGWWSKLGLFRYGKPQLYFDLDVVITGDLSPLVDWDEFGIIKDWWLAGFNSSVMKLTGREPDIYREFHPSLMRALPGDQDFISLALPGAKTFPSEWLPSYKANNCEAAAPDGALAVIFHGHPKPHECGGWVKDYWTNTNSET